jgi:hypothetical protein
MQTMTEKVLYLELTSKDKEENKGPENQEPDQSGV